MFTKKKIKVYLDLCWPPLADLVQQWLKNIGVVVINLKFITSIENRQTKILIVKKEN
jgi:hypothetical protein